MCPIFTGVESRVTKISYSHSYIRFFIHRTGTFPFNLQRCQNYLKFGAIPWGFNFLFSPSYLSLKAAESENFAWVGFAYFFFLSGWCCNQEVVTRSYTFYSTFVSFSLILENEEINVTEKKNQPKTDEEPEKFHHKHVMFGKVRSKWGKDLTLAEMRQVS